MRPGSAVTDAVADNDYLKAALHRVNDRGTDAAGGRGTGDNNSVDMVSGEQGRQVSAEKR